MSHSRNEFRNIFIYILAFMKKRNEKIMIFDFSFILHKRNFVVNTVPILFHMFYA